MIDPHYGLVVSLTAFNVATGYVVVIPITSKRDKLSSFELAVKVGRVDGVALPSGLRSLDYTARDIRFEARAPATLGIAANKMIVLFLPTA